MSYTINDIVGAVGELNLEGNIIPIEWFKYIKFDNGKPDTAAILILSDVVYWYRPTVVRDELTSRIKEYKKKFKADLLQKNYQDYADFFGFSKRQVINAFVRLEHLGLIKRIFRTVTTPKGKIPNVLYVELIPSMLKKISSNELGPTLESDISPFLKRDISLFKEGYPTLERDTNTEITTNTTTKRERGSSLLKISSSDSRERNRSQEGTKLEVSWTLPDEWRSWTKEVFHWRNDLIAREENKFRNYWVSKAGKDAFKLDWRAVWENWCHRAVEFAGGKLDFSKDEEPQTEKSLIDEIEQSAENGMAKAVRLRLLESLGTTIYKTWFKDLSIEMNDSVVTFVAPSMFCRDRIKTQYGSDILRILSVLPQKTIEFV